LVELRFRVISMISSVDRQACLGKM